MTRAGTANRSAPGATADAAAPFVAFCPSCLSRAKIPGTLAVGKRVKCPKCQQPFDPRGAGASGTNRLKTEKMLAEGDDPGLAEWKWALIIGGVSGVLAGALLGYIIGMLITYAPGGPTEGIFGNLITFAILGAIGYAMYGIAIAMAMHFTGGSTAGYIVAGIGVIPACGIFFLGFGRWGIIFGLGVTLGFAAGIERMMDYKLYS